jgi:hypothetical protein
MSGVSSTAPIIVPTSASAVVIAISTSTFAEPELQWSEQRTHKSVDIG